MSNFDLLPMSFYIFYVFLIGLCIGSFLNVVILRGLSGENFVFERSKCPKCNNQLKWYMNIPLLSYIFLRGKCAYCKEKISIQYPIIEFLTACFFLASFLTFGFTLNTIFIWIILSLFITMAVTDIKETVIIDYHAYILLIVGLIYSISGLSSVGIIESILSAVAGFIIFELLARIGILISGCRMFGEGDSLIALSLGSIFGFKSLILIIGLSILFQSITSIPILLLNAYKKKNIKLSFSYIFVLLGVIAMICSKCFDLVQYPTTYTITSFVIVIFLFWSLKNIMEELHNKKLDTDIKEEDKFCILPFGPALIISATLCIFYLPQIKNIIFSVLN